MNERGDRPVQVVVIDDVVRFAVHVWRYLDRSLGFGIGAIPIGDCGPFRRGDGLAPVATADGRAEIWWIPAGRSKPGGKTDSAASTTGSVTAQIKEIGRLRPARPTLYLVDVKSKTDPTYDPRDVLEALAGDSRWNRDRDRIMVVSSYAAGVSGYTLWPKSPETFREVNAWVDQAGPKPHRQSGGEAGASDPIVEVLVTGAGFEYAPRPRFSSPGAKDFQEGFGLPQTDELLRSMGRPFRRLRRPGGEVEEPGGDGEGGEIRLKDRRLGTSFPVPVSDAVTRSQAIRSMVKWARERDLDEWWNTLLEAELAGQWISVKDPRDRRASKRNARRREARLREAFRSSMVRHDWGHLRQAVLAAQQPWAAWLTTNYTRFTNRAVALVAQARARGEREADRSPRWRVIATAQEAQLLIRELQDLDVQGSHLDEEAHLEGGRTPLFKLHGDITHLQTMAIAGHDKELFTSLAVPVDSLYQVYDAAEKFLLQLLRDTPGAVLRLHVVGHSLKDAALVRVLDTVARFHSGVRERSGGSTVPSPKLILRLVSPDSRADLEASKDALELAAPSAWHFDLVPGTNAEQYMAREHARGRSHREGASGSGDR